MGIFGASIQLLNRRTRLSDENGGQGSPPTHWQYFRAELWRRTITPFQHVTFFLYFFTSIILIGGLGLWLEVILLYRSGGEFDNVRAALATFAFGLFGSSALHIFLGDAAKQLKIFAALMMLVAVGLAGWIIIDKQLGDWTAVKLGAAGSILGLWFWCIVNSDEPIFQDSNIRAPTGGADPQAPLLNNGMDEFDA